MGKQRYWGGQATKKTPSVSTKRVVKNDLDNEASSSSTSAGCMCAVFQLFDFHPLNHLPSQSSVSINPPPDDHISKGTEAPRNSLESEEEELDISPLPCTKTTPKQKEDTLRFPKGIVQIKTKSNGIANNLSAGNDSPSTKTPTLVARLMGLDILPESNSPSTTPRNGYSKAKKRGGSRSLPETPRTSCERKSNVDNYHHRLSLQIPNYDNKENNANTNPSPSPSPTHYAKEIVKQIKESVSRKAGLNDITNYNYNTRRDQDIIKHTKPKKLSSLSSSSVSPRQRVLEPKNNFNKLHTQKVEGIKEVSLGTTKPKKQKGVKSATRVAALKKGNKREEPFVVPSRITKAAIDAPLKKTPLSNQLFNFGSVPTTILINKHPPFSSPIKPSSMQPPCKRNQCTDETGDKESKRYLQSNNHQHLIQLPTNKDGNNPKHHITTTIAATAAAANCSDNREITAELDYVRQILLRRSTTTSPTVYSSVFLENLNYNNAHNYNVSISHRKLLCHLVEELLKPYLEVKPYRCPESAERWPDMVEKLCEKVRKLPRTKCEVLEDIDGIIEKDLDILGIGFEDESEGMVKEIEEWIVEELLKETVRFVETEMAG
ncbi:uncharacterized protein LOC120073400 [Benincasa hispida]|uniref:uncharacterized protein LOC120073400 n=1 Tax=Benincasa hispida TaxID=102211 RepID=UPI0019022FB4|nr:uncharacterized protein LOC120073400 [Benincasa hispida]